MTKAQTKRDHLAQVLADHVLAHGLAGASLRPLAMAAGTSDRMLLYYFTDKDDLIATVLSAIAERLAHLLSTRAGSAPVAPDRLEAELVPLITSAEFWPFICVWLEIATMAARGDAALRAIGGAIAGQFRQWIALRLDLPSAQRDAAALRLLRLVEGTALLHALGQTD